MKALGGLVLGVSLLACASGCDSSSAAEKTPERAQEATRVERSQALSAEPIQPLAFEPQKNGALVKLGERLFHDPILSKNDSVSCATCHDLKKGGDDGLVRSKGIDGKQGDVNAPTVFNAALNIAQFWDGRAATLEDQIDGPVENTLEMASDWKTIEKKLRGDSSYVKEFESVLGEKPSRQGVKKAIATFERTLITVGSPFDRWLEGDEKALSKKQKEGYDLFKANGCIACHQGQNVGGNMYQRFGVFGNYFEDRGGAKKPDFGRFNVTGKESDRFVFRVPSLRNVALTAPYFHDGSAKTLPEAVGIMAKYQLGREISSGQVEKLVAFLESLTGPEKQYLASSQKGKAQ